MLNFLPLPHTVSIQKAQDALDEWGVAVGNEAQVTQHRAKINYNSSNETISIASGELIRYQATILFEGTPQIDYKDFVVWTDEFGNSHKKQPLEISYKYDLSGNPVALKVVV